jgi:cardiolipin synthase A/B
LAQARLICIFIVSLSVFFNGCESLPNTQLLKQASQRAGIEQSLAQMRDDSLLARQEKILELVNGQPATLGNESEILIDGPQTWASILLAVKNAKRYIFIESFIFEDIHFGEKISDLLIARRAAGVDVHIIYDSFGSIGTPISVFENLRQKKIAVCEFNPVSVWGGRLTKLNHRDHRKIIVIDGEVAFTGGINFHSVYRSGSATQLRTKMPSIDEGWRDTHVKIQGPAVTDLETLFRNTWAKQACGVITLPAAIRSADTHGPHHVAIVGSSPDGMLSRMYLLLISSISYAEKSVWLTTAYFAPDPITITALTTAAKRGVDVRLLLPGISDSSLAFHAGRSHYQELLAAGVRIFEQRGVLLHAKTVVVDGVWSSIGSSNVDWRSFCHNDEVNAIFIGTTFGWQMAKVFEDDLGAAHEISVQEWQSRDSLQRLREWWARQFEYLL